MEGHVSWSGAFARGHRGHLRWQQVAALEAEHEEPVESLVRDVAQRGLQMRPHGFGCVVVARAVASGARAGTRSRHDGTAAKPR
jgi:hypothetical protein